MHFVMRLADGSDLETLARFRRELYDYDRIPMNEARGRAALERIVRNPALGRVWLICDGDAAVGYAVLTLGYSLEYEGIDAFIDEIYLQESHRGQGAGALAFRRVEEEARALDVQAIHLEVERTNMSAQAFYHRMGFEDHERYLLTKWVRP